MNEVHSGWKVNVWRKRRLRHSWWSKKRVVCEKCDRREWKVKLKCLWRVSRRWMVATETITQLRQSWIISKNFESKKGAKWSESCGNEVETGGWLKWGSVSEKDEAVFERLQFGEAESETQGVSEWCWAYFWWRDRRFNSLVYNTFYCMFSLSILCKLATYIQLFLQCDISPTLCDNARHPYFLIRTLRHNWPP